MPRDEKLEGYVAYHAGLMQNASLLATGSGNLENKNTALIAGIFVIAPLLLTNVENWYILTPFGVYGMTVSLAFAIAAGWPRDAYPPTGDIEDPKFVHHLGEPARDHLMWLTSEALTAYKNTETQNKLKSKAYKISLITLTIGIAVFLMSFHTLDLPVVWWLFSKS